MVAKKKGRLASAKKKAAARKTTTRKPVERAAHGIGDSAQHIWLAGLGAFAVAQKEGPKFFDRLVEEGNKVQNRTKQVAGKAVNQTVKDMRDAVDSGVESMRSQVTTTWDNLEKVFQDRVARSLKQLGVPTADELDSLSRKVDNLARSVRELTKTRSVRARKAPARKSKPAAKAAAQLEMKAA
jgi:poly(hydroxyalkanoate) granule-associated protein